MLDFVGYHRKEFRFDAKLRALTGQTRRGLEREIERGFPFLPSGCQIVMDRKRDCFFTMSGDFVPDDLVDALDIVMVGLQQQRIGT